MERKRAEREEEEGEEDRDQDEEIHEKCFSRFQSVCLSLCLNQNHFVHLC